MGDDVGGSYLHGRLPAWWRRRGRPRRRLGRPQGRRAPGPRHLRLGGRAPWRRGRPLGRHRPGHRLRPGPDPDRAADGSHRLVVRRHHRRLDGTDGSTDSTAATRSRPGRRRRDLRRAQGWQRPGHAPRRRRSRPDRQLRWRGQIRGGRGNDFIEAYGAGPATVFGDWEPTRCPRRSPPPPGWAAPAVAAATSCSLYGDQLEGTHPARIHRSTCATAPPPPPPGTGHQKGTIGSYEEYRLTGSCAGLLRIARPRPGLDDHGWRAARLDRTAATTGCTPRSATTRSTPASAPTRCRAARATTSASAPSAAPADRSGAEHQHQVAAVDGLGARRARSARPCPSTGAVIEASIFIASMVATVSPAATWSPSATAMRDDALERRGDVPRLARVGLLGGGTSDATARSRTLTGPQLAVDGRHHRAEAALVGLADRLRARGSASCPPPARPRAPRRGAARRGSRGWAAPTRRRTSRATRRTRLVGPGEQQLVEGRPRGRLRSASGLLVGDVPGRRLPGAALERLGAERLRPAAGRVAELAVEEADHRVRDVELAGVLRELRRVGADAPTRCSARSPTTFDDGVTLTMLPRMSLAAAYMSSICSNFSPSPSAIACWRRLDSWPPGISCR